MFQQLLAIIRNTFFESVRQPVVLVVLVGAALLIVLSNPLSAFTMDENQRMLIDIGLATIFMSAALLSGFIATSVLGREISNKTALTVISKPVGRPLFVIGKFLGVALAMMLATLFDYPFEKRRDLTHWSDMATGMNNPDICPGGEEQWKREMMECLATFMQIFQERGAQPQKNDLISLLAHGEKTRNMTPMELLGNVILLIVGGNDTTRNSMTASVYALNKFPAEYDKLKADLSLIPNMVSETIRWQTPLAHMRRTALEDVEMHGQTIKKGDQVAMWYVSGNRDERFWDRPNDYIIDRPDARRHISFGFGIHRCVGNRLAELQLQILWQELMERFSHIEVLDEPSFSAGGFVKGYTWMPVVLHGK